jgi:glycosyltransferase involved in cell wall biosynthesis
MTQKVYAISMVRDEKDIIKYSINYLMSQNIDGMIIADNMSEDGTQFILSRLQEKWGDMLTIVQDNEPAYYQSQKMTDLAHLVHKDFGAEWIIPFDADEFWYSKHGKIGPVLKNTEEDVVIAPVWHMVLKNSDDMNLPPQARMNYRREQPEQFPVVAFRYNSDIIIHQGNHDVDHAGARIHGTIEVKHYQYRSFSQFVHKVRNGAEAYNATDLPYGQGQHWREYSAMSDEDLQKEWDQMSNEVNLVYDPLSYVGN